jgi:hypothetical protein
MVRKFRGVVYKCFVEKQCKRNFAKVGRVSTGKFIASFTVLQEAQNQHCEDFTIKCLFNLTSCSLFHLKMYQLLFQHCAKQWK